ncbi:hypothetical protein M8C21_017878, partial [Ambrosia artemisiifolia]
LNNIITRQQQQLHHHQDQQSRVFHDLSALILNLIRYPPLPVHFSGDLSRRQPLPSQITPAGFASIMETVRVVIELPRKQLMNTMDVVSEQGCSGRRRKLVVVGVHSLLEEAYGGVQEVASPSLSQRKQRGLARYLAKQVMSKKAWGCTNGV